MPLFLNHTLRTFYEFTTWNSWTQKWSTSLVSCKKVFPENMNWLFSAKILFWLHLLNLDIMGVMMVESWLILEVKFIWKMNKSGAVRAFHAKSSSDWKWFVTSVSGWVCASPWCMDRGAPRYPLGGTSQ